jgi:WD40 repeat protein
VTTVVGYQQSPNGDIYVASSSADSTVKVWRITDTTTCLHTLEFKNGFAITLELVPLDNHKDSKFSFLHRIEIFLF